MHICIGFSLLDQKSMLVILGLAHGNYLDGPLLILSSCGFHAETFGEIAPDAN